VWAFPGAFPWVSRGHDRPTTGTPHGDSIHRLERRSQIALRRRRQLRRVTQAALEEAVVLAPDCSSLYSLRLRAAPLGRRSHGQNAQTRTAVDRGPPRAALPRFRRRSLRLVEAEPWRCLVPGLRWPSFKTTSRCCATRCVLARFGRSASGTAWAFWTLRATPRRDTELGRWSRARTAPATAPPRKDPPDTYSPRRPGPQSSFSATGRVAVFRVTRETRPPES